MVLVLKTMTECNCSLSYGHCDCPLNDDSTLDSVVDSRYSFNSLQSEDLDIVIAIKNRLKILKQRQKDIMKRQVTLALSQMEWCNKGKEVQEERVRLLLELEKYF